MSGFSATVRRIIRKRAGDRCERCGMAFGMQIHHRRVKGSGGSKQKSTNQPSNGLLFCGRCHREVHHDPDVSAEHGWLVSQWADPLEVPVLYRGILRRLDDLGNLWT